MRRSGSDRFIAEPSEDEPDVSAEVYVVETDDGRRHVAIGWGYLAVVIAILATAAALVVKSFTAGAGHSSSAPARAGQARSPQVLSATSRSASSCVDARGYGGLGGRVSAFDANNNNSVGPAEPTPGTAFYVVTRTARGCVTAFAVQDSSTPPLAARDLLVLVSHPYLPRDAKQIANTDRCAVWKSLALKRATGRAYARATAIAQAASNAGRAQIEATSNSTC